MTELKPADTVQLADAIAAMLDQALSRLRRDDTEARVYPIPEAAERMNMSARTLEQWCRDDTIVHTKIGKFRGLTAKQIDRVLAQHEVGGLGKPAVVADDELAAARSQSAKNVTRKTRGRAA